MPNDRVSYQDSGYFSKLIIDYLNRDPAVEKLYHRFPDLENFKEQIAEKEQNFNGNREVLVNALARQYKGSKTSPETDKNLRLLANPNCFTVTTGHQLNLFTGPLYFLYKIITAINLARKLKERYPDNDFVPVFWMASEDHDFDEISYFNFRGKKFRWPRESSGAVGRLSTEGLDEVLKLFSSDAGPGENAKWLTSFFSSAYIGHESLSSASRYIANELFSTYGLVIIDGDDKDLKKLFSPYIAQELKEQFSHTSVKDTIQDFEYDVQVNPREINLFYLDGNIRERIVRDGGTFRINNTEINFTESEILALVASNPEKFSPNVILRPLYQEVILPNLCYVGGGGELAYWFELRSMFGAAGVAFPVLLLRNSVLLATEKLARKADRLGLEWKDLFLSKDRLADLITKRHSEDDVDFAELHNQLKTQFARLRDAAAKTDKSFANAIEAQQTRQQKGLENLEKKFRRAQKKKYADEIQRAVSLKEILFPMGQLQERFSNFSEFFADFGNIIPQLQEQLEPFDQSFSIAILE